MLLALALTLVQADPLPGILLKPSPDGGTFVVAPFPVEQLNAVVAELGRRGAAHCGSKTLRWGRYDSAQQHVTEASGESGLRYGRYDQQFSCYDPANDPFPPAPADWVATEADNAAAMDFARRHLAALARGDVAALGTNWEPLVGLTPGELTIQAADFRVRSGGKTFKLARPRWLSNLASAAHPGIYAYVAFHAPHACGYLVLYRARPATYQVSRQEVHGAPVPPEDLTPVQRAALADACAKI
jgi:hypothetical protein